MTKILIAEDERDIRELITYTLQHSGFDVVATADGESALDLVLSEMPDLVLLDVRMPRMDGYEVCRQIKSNHKLASIPVAFLSAKGQEAEVRAGMEAGAQAYILKPFSMDQLLTQIELILKAQATT
jgi:two-component system alkaline phosphatase synthesis response regulator PhoP